MSKLELPIPVIMKQQAVPSNTTSTGVATYAVDSDFLFKFVLIGDEQVGKTCLLQRFTEDMYDVQYRPTIGVEFKIQVLEIDNKQIKLQLWDTAGQERFRTLSTTYFKGSHGAVIVYDITNQESFDHLDRWISDFQENGGKAAVSVLVGNKADLEDKRQVKEEEAEALAKKHGMLFMETSAKSCFNVENLFLSMCHKAMTKTNICEEPTLNQPSSKGETDVKVKTTDKKEDKKNVEEKKTVAKKRDKIPFKICLIGDCQVGKSSILNRYTHHEFMENYSCTIGVDFIMRETTVDDETYKLQIWDTAGQERFRSITRSYYKGATGVILVYDVTNQESFNNLQKWYVEIMAVNDTGVNVILLGNKCDAEKERVVSKGTAQKFAEKLDVPYIETSALGDINVDEAFSQLTKKMIKWWETSEPETKSQLQQQTVQKPIPMPRKVEIQTTPTPRNDLGPGYDFLMRLLLLGDESVGKTCLLERYVDGDFSSPYLPTIGVDFKTKNVALDKYLVRLQVWDTAGQERFRTITTAYYRGTAGILIVFDVTNQDSFDHVPNWFEDVKQYTSSVVQCVLVGNKADMAEQRVVDYNKAKDFADEHEMKYIETSAKTSSNVDAAFQILISQVDQHNERSSIMQLANSSLAPAKYKKKSSFCNIL
ncbi:hypothetical protein ScPMuIL_013734 [Solemya velum]